MRDNKIDKIIEIIDKTIALKKIMSNANGEGKYVSIPLVFNDVWFISIYIAAKAGPIDDPIILNRLLTPIVTTEYSLGAARIITFIAPTLANDKPADKRAKLAAI